MFIQVIQGEVADAEGLRAAMDRWGRDPQHGALGWLGTTGGITDDGTFVATVRFDSEEAARRDGEVFDDVWMQGGTDDAGFVQVMEGHTSDADRMREMMRQYADEMHELRPEIIGATIALHGDGAFGGDRVLHLRTGGAATRKRATAAGHGRNHAARTTTDGQHHLPRPAPAMAGLPDTLTGPSPTHSFTARPGVDRPAGRTPVWGTPLLAHGPRCRGGGGCVRDTNRLSSHLPIPSPSVLSSPVVTPLMKR